MANKILVLAVGLALSVAVGLKPARAAIIANIGDKAISDEQIKNEYDAISGDQKKAINKDDATRRSMVDSVVNAEVLYEAAKKANMDKDPEYKAALERFQKQYLASKFMEKALENKLGKTELKKFFEENKSFFDTTQVCAHHIVTADEDAAKKLLQQAEKKGANFEELAAKNSIDPTAQDNKGNLGCFTRERMVPEFAAAAFQMKKKEIRGPVRSMYGYHIIQVDDIKRGSTPGYEEVEQRVKDTLRLKLVTEILTDLRAKSNVKIHDEAVKNLRL